MPDGYGPRFAFGWRRAPLGRRRERNGQFSTDEVFIRKEGEDVILSPRPRDWRPYLEGAPIASDAFMNDVEDVPVQER